MGRRVVPSTAMCCFSGVVASVSDTCIFARMDGPSRQWLVYQMTFAAAQETALVLPLPVARGAGEDAVHFVDLSEAPDFFADLDAGFPETAPSWQRITGSRSMPAMAVAMLPVQNVGSFVASFVPTRADFARLDPRFRIDERAWAQLPAYGDHGFAVFRLRERAGRPHPMAFSFPTRLPGKVFFPTVHIHDGQVHPRERFDHALYLQSAAWDAAVGGYDGPTHLDPATGFVRSLTPFKDFVSGPPGRALVAPELLVHRKEMKGVFDNRDVVQEVTRAPSPSLVRRVALPLTAATVAAGALAWVVRRRNARRAPGRSDPSAK